MIAFRCPRFRRDVDGQTGLDKVLALLARLLNPSFSESGGLFMGDLIIHLLRNAGSHLGAVLPSLLQALVARIAIAETPSYVSVSSLRRAERAADSRRS
jgi:hypothetical protein